MNKDAILATLIGLLVGALVTGIILIGPTVVKELPQVKIPQIALPNFKLPSLAFLATQKKDLPRQELTPTPNPQEFFVSIDSPLPEAIESKDTLIVSGSSKEQAIIIIQGEIDENVISVNGDGKYAGEVTLAEGKNTIKVTAYRDDKNATQSVVVYYTPETF